MSTKKRITQKEIAALAHVCPSAVSVVLSPNGKGNTKVAPEVRERIIEIARKYNYCPNYQARALRGGSSGLVGVLTNPQLSQFFYDILLPLEVELHKVRKRAIIAQLGNDTAENEEVLRSFVNYSLDGMIVLHHDIADCVRLFNAYLALLPQLVFLDPPAPELGNIRWVGVDYAAGVAEAVAHLVKNKYRRIGLFMNDIEFRSMKMRLEGYRAGLAAAGIAFDARLLHIGPPGQDSLPKLASEAVRHLVLEERADAIIAGNDQWASATLKALAANNLHTPGDVAVIGYGNTVNICESTSPELTSIDHSVRTLARALVATLTGEMMPGALLKTSLTIRNSTIPTIRKG
jgi:transcriptional regulator, lacI family